jgi:DNA-directed RNA polymerase specialized sigma24 family protein
MEARRGSGAWEASMLAALKRGEERAATALYDGLFPGLLTVAARTGVPYAERDELVADTLRRVLTALAREGSVTPASLMAYAMRAMRNLRREQASSRESRERLVQAVREEVVVQGVPANDDVESAVPSRHSHALGALARALEAHATTEELQVLSWLADMAPQRDIARWLGITHGAARVRIHRVRTRLRGLAGRIAQSMSPADQRELERFFRRAGIRPPSTPTRRATRGRSATDAETS